MDLEGAEGRIFFFNIQCQEKCCLHRLCHAAVPQQADLPVASTLSGPAVFWASSLNPLTAHKPNPE